MKNLLLILIVLLMSSSILFAQNSSISNEFILDDLKEDFSISSSVSPQMEMFNPEETKEAEEVTKNLLGDETRLSTASSQPTSVVSTSSQYQTVLNEANTAQIQGTSEVEDTSVKSLALGEDRFSRNTLRGTALRIYCEHWLGEVGATEEGSSYANKALECGVDPQLVKAFNECCHNVKISLDSGGFLALSWIQVAEDLQNAIEDSIKSAPITKSQSHLTCLGNGGFWGRTTPATLQLVKYKAGLVRSSVLCQRSAIVSAWKKTVRQSQCFVENHRKTEACVLETNEISYLLGLNWWKYMYFNNLLKMAGYSLKKATIANQEGKQSFVPLWLNLAHENQLLLERGQNKSNFGTLAFLTEEEPRDLDQGSVKCLESAQRMLDKAMLADQRGRQEEVTLYKKVAEQYRVVVECERLAAEAYTQGNTADGDCLHEEASKALKVANEAERVARIWKKGKRSNFNKT